MDTSCTFQIHLDGCWHDAASLSLMGPPERGWRTAAYTGYTVPHAVEHMGRRDAAALSASYPVGLSPLQTTAWPAFAMDLLPQGYGRAELLRQLSLPEIAEETADWPLLCAGAGNPIGNMRVKEAHAWLAERTQNDRRGFPMEEVARRAEDFSEYLAQNGLFVAGSSGVQGEWPKILLTEGRDGLFYLDHALPDEEAERHYLVKFGRGPNPALADILRLEAPYMRLARYLGLRVHADLQWHERALFIPRFDRSVEGGRVVRHAQESIASLCSVSGFGIVPSHNETCRLLAAVATEPAAEIIEYLRRDVVNIALGNKDNHARNTALQRRHDGHIALTPLFDFSPALLHPDGIARRMRWEHDDHGSPTWASAVDQACAAAGIAKDPVVTALRAMAGPMRDLRAYALDVGIDCALVDRLTPTIDNIAGQLERL
jgi:serine/threonine-protein kinase HipA